MQAGFKLKLTHQVAAQIWLCDIDWGLSVDLWQSLTCKISLLLLLLYAATYTLTQPLRSGSGRGSLVGYSAAGPPLYNFAGDALQRTSQSVMVLARSGLRQILEESDSRRIFYFLCVNLVSSDISSLNSHHFSLYLVYANQNFCFFFLVTYFPALSNSGYLNGNKSICQLFEFSNLIK